MPSPQGFQFPHLNSSHSWYFFLLLLAHVSISMIQRHFSLDSQVFFLHCIYVFCMYVCMYVCTQSHSQSLHTKACGWGAENNLGESVFSFHLWISGLSLKLSGLAAGTLTQLVNLLAPNLQIILLIISLCINEICTHRCFKPSPLVSTLEVFTF